MNLIGKTDLFSLFTNTVLLTTGILSVCYGQAPRAEWDDASFIMPLEIMTSTQSLILNNWSTRCDRAGRTVLHWAAFLGNLEAVKVVLEEGQCNVNAEDRYGTTALHLAAYNGHIDSVKLLVRHNAFINAQDCQGYTPLHLALFHNHVNLTEFKARQTALIDAAYVMRNHRPSSHAVTQAEAIESSSYHPLACMSALILTLSSWLGRIFSTDDDAHFEVVRYLLQHGAALTWEESVYIRQKLSALDEKQERHAVGAALEAAHQCTGLSRDLNRLICHFTEQNTDPPPLCGDHSEMVP